MNPDSEINSHRGPRRAQHPGFTRAVSREEVALLLGFARRADDTVARPEARQQGIRQQGERVPQARKRYLTALLCLARSRRRDRSDQGGWPMPRSRRSPPPLPWTLANTAKRRDQRNPISSSPTLAPVAPCGRSHRPGDPTENDQAGRGTGNSRQNHDGLASDRWRATAGAYAFAVNPSAGGALAVPERPGGRNRNDLEARSDG